MKIGEGQYWDKPLQISLGERRHFGKIFLSSILFFYRFILLSVMFSLSLLPLLFFFFFLFYHLYLWVLCQWRKKVGKDREKNERMVKRVDGKLSRVLLCCLPALWRWSEAIQSRKRSRWQPGIFFQKEEEAKEEVLIKLKFFNFPYFLKLVLQVFSMKNKKRGKSSIRCFSSLLFNFLSPI